MTTRFAQLAFTPHFPGLLGVTLTADAFDIEPFLVLTEFHMDRPVFGPHPHAGISVMTYLLPDSAGSFHNRDSDGDFSLIEPGGLHITQAGRGIHHDEYPTVVGTDVHGFQIWINHAHTDRLVAPRAMHAGAADIVEVRSDDVTVRVLHGTYAGVRAPHHMVTDVTLLHVLAKPGATFTVPGAPMTFVYGVRGDATLLDERCTPQSVLVRSDTDDAIMTAGADGVELLYGAGIPHREPIVYGGPFVMTTREQMADTQRRYARGEMGSLESASPRR